MKKIFTVLLAVAFLCSLTAMAMAGEREKILTGYINTGIFSKYVCNGATPYKHSVIQPAVGIAYEPLGLYAEIWGSYSPKGGWDSDFGDEIDYTIGWAPEYKGFKLDVGYSYFNMISLKNATGDLHDFYVSIVTPAIYGLTPSVTFNFNVPQDRNVLEGGVIYTVNLEKELKIVDRPIAIKMTAVGHDGIYGAKPETVSSLNLRLATMVKVLKSLEVTPEVNFQKRVGKRISEGGSSKDLIWYGAKINYPFDIL